jgi:DNA-binding transcriptional regulator YdaS (Cro superfamily)
MTDALLDSVGVFKQLRAACKAAGGQQAWAERHGLSASYVSDVLNGRRDPGESILRALGLAKVVRYVVQRRVNG